SVAQLAGSLVCVECFITRERIASAWATRIRRKSGQSAGVPNRRRTAANGRFGCRFAAGSVNRKAEGFTIRCNSSGKILVQRRATSGLFLGEARMLGRNGSQALLIFVEPQNFGRLSCLR